MWDRYRKHFFGMQVVIVLFTIAVVFIERQLGAALTAFAVMQVASVLGAYWGHRMRSRMQGRAW